MKILITGGCGFIGSHLCEHIYKNTNWDIFIIDKLSYASKGTKRLEDSNLLPNPRIKLFTCDLSLPLSDGIILELGDINYIAHLAAETHIDNSIDNPVPFIRNNIMSTVYLLEYARKLKFLKKFICFSTDEVYGAAPMGTNYKEWDRHKPTNPYSASKSSSEQICVSYENSYKLPIVIVNCMNAIGERQHTEKFVPKLIKLIKNNEIAEIHTDPFTGEPGSRFYIHARNISSAVLFLFFNGISGEKYNITGEKEVNNLEMAQLIAKIMGKELKYKMIDFHTIRPGHDSRYSLCGDKLINMGWLPGVKFEDTLKKVVDWTLEHEEWLNF